MFLPFLAEHATGSKEAQAIQSAEIAKEKITLAYAAISPSMLPYSDGERDRCI